MKFIEPSVEIINQEAGIKGLYKMMELAGRTAYKSEDKITDDSATKFVNMLISRGHGAALEHGTLYLFFQTDESQDGSDYGDPFDVKSDFIFSKYSTVRGSLEGDKLYVTTNYRELLRIFEGMEDSIPRFLDCHMMDYNPAFERRVTVKFTCDRGVSHEFVRHRVFSFLQESTRYCNYSKDKFGGEITYIIPRWIHDIQERIAGTVDPLTYDDRSGFRKYQGKALMDMLCVHDRTVAEYVDTLSKIEDCYINCTTLDDGTKLVPQQARQILPNCLKTELIMTGTISQWEGFFKLRCAKDAHPDARYLADSLKQQFIERGYLN